jgi:hypothetical protein
MAPSLDKPGHHNTLSTPYNGKPPSSEDLDEKFVGSNQEFSQGHVVSIIFTYLTFSNPESNSSLYRYQGTTTPTGLEMG